MDVLLINDTKLKIMLTHKDCKGYGLDPGSVEYDDPNCRKIFWEILDDAKKKCGFDVSHDKVLIQLYPSKDGSCEVFVTKLGAISQSVYKSLEKSDKVALLSTKRVLYKFSELNNLILAVKAISPINEDAVSEVYYAEDGFYYLYVSERGGNDSPVGKYARLCEFGDAVSIGLVTYLKEHAKCLSDENAVQIFCRL